MEELRRLDHLVLNRRDAHTSNAFKDTSQTDERTHGLLFMFDFAQLPHAAGAPF
jgi:hypothetical protein